MKSKLFSCKSIKKQPNKLFRTQLEAYKVQDVSGGLSKFSNSTLVGRNASNVENHCCIGQTRRCNHVKVFILLCSLAGLIFKLMFFKI